MSQDRTLELVEEIHNMLAGETVGDIMPALCAVLGGIICWSTQSKSEAFNDASFAMDTVKNLIDKHWQFYHTPECTRQRHELH
jgi:hypothetical protein